MLIRSLIFADANIQILTKVHSEELVFGYIWLANEVIK
jgi:hypothetical protein